LTEGARRRWPAALALAAVVAIGFMLPSGPKPEGWEAAVVRLVRRAPGSRGWLVSGWLAVLGSPGAVIAATAGLVGGLVGSGRLALAKRAFLAVALGAGGAELAKHVIDRRIDPQLVLGYPSGHTAGATAVGVTALLVLAPVLDSRSVRWVLCLAALAAGAAVGLAMVSLGSHYPADVLGGLGWGFCVPWLVFAGSRGRVTVNTAPPEPALAAAARPPCSPATAATIDSPNPVPAPERDRSARQNRSKT